MSPLGIIGSRILDMCDETNELFVFKHQYISQALDSVILYDLLDAIRNRNSLSIRVEKEINDIVKKNIRKIQEAIKGNQCISVCIRNRSTRNTKKADIIPLKFESRGVTAYPYVLCWYKEADKKHDEYRRIRIDRICEVDNKTQIQYNQEDISLIINEGKEQYRIGDNYDVPEMSPVLVQADIVPIQIRSSALDGRQYVFCWYEDAKVKKYHSLRLDYIHDIKRNENTIDDIEDVITQGRAYASVLWGTTLTKTGSMRIEFSFDPKTEAHIGQRIEREKRIGHIENNGEGSKVLILDRVSCSKDIMPWLLSFTGYITKIESNNRHYQGELQKSFLGHISSLNDMYLYKKYSWEHSDSPYVPVKEQVFKKWDTASEDKVIFSEFGCDYFECRRRILNKLKKKKTPKEVKSIIETEIQRLGQSDEVRKNISCTALINEGLLLQNEDGTVRSAFPNMVQRPFINTELRWIRAILEDERIGLFLKEGEVKELRILLSKYHPLYNVEDVCYFDMYQDGDDFGSELLKERFSVLCEAIFWGKPLVITYKASANGKETSYIVVPLKIEYSHLENKLRLLAYNTRDAGKGHAQTRAYLLSRITKIEEYTGDRSFSEDLTWENFNQLCDHPLEVLVPASVKRNTLERFMIAFSPYKKEVVGYDERREAYYIKIWYYKDDLKELLCKIRSYGSDIEVLVSPPVEKKKTPRDMITERISRQYAMLVEDRLIEW